MARRITAFLISIVLVFSLAVISFGVQSPLTYDFSDRMNVNVNLIDGSSVQHDSPNIVFDWSTAVSYSWYPNPNYGYSAAESYFIAVFTGFTDIGLSSLDLSVIKQDFAGNWDIIDPETVYDPSTGFFSVTVNCDDSMSFPNLWMPKDLIESQGLSFINLTSANYILMFDELATNSSLRPISALTANSELDGTVTLNALSNLSEQRFNPIFSEPLYSGTTYLISLGVTQTGALSEDIVQPIQLTGLWNGTISNLGAAIPYTHHMAESSMYYQSQYYSGSATGTESGNFAGSGSLIGSASDYGVLSGTVGSQGTYVGTGQHTESGLITGSTVGFMPVTQTATFLYTPTVDISNPFTFEIGCSGSNYEWSANVTVQALPVAGVQLDDVQENQSFAAWLNNKLDSIFGGIAARLDAIFSKQDQAYEDAADDAVDEGLGQVEQEHQREEELTQEAISNLNESLNAVELPDLTQQQEINSGIGLLNTVIFDGFFGNPQMRFLLIFSLGMALAAVVLRLNH